MVQIIPAINSESWEDVVKKIRLAESFSEWVHIDVANGTFAPNTLWHNPFDLLNFETKAKIEIHLMEDRPEDRVEAWLMDQVKRIIVHFEVTHDLNHIVKECHREKIQVGLAIAPHTSWSHLKPFVGKVDLFQILAVHPGKHGQHFERHNISKIKHLRVFSPKSIIEVDGGITPEIADECIQAGANILVSASYVFSHPSQKMAMRELAHIA